MMDEAQFWQMIDKARTAANGDQEKMVDLLTASLVALPVEEIIAYDRIQFELQVTANIWELYDAADIVGGGCTEDGFIDFRAWLMSHGRDVYYAAMKDPEGTLMSLADSIETNEDPDYPFY